MEESYPGGTGKAEHPDSEGHAEEMPTNRGFADDVDIDAESCPDADARPGQVDVVGVTRVRVVLGEQLNNSHRPHQDEDRGVDPARRQFIPPVFLIPIHDQGSHIADRWWLLALLCVLTLAAARSGRGQRASG